MANINVEGGSNSGKQVASLGPENEEGNFLMLYWVIKLFCLSLLLELQRAKPIPISQFSEIVKRKHFNANIAFEDEFEASLKHYWRLQIM